MSDEKNARIRVYTRLLTQNHPDPQQKDLREIMATYGELPLPMVTLLNTWQDKTFQGLHYGPVKPVGITGINASAPDPKQPVSLTEAAINKSNGEAIIKQTLLAKPTAILEGPVTKIRKLGKPQFSFSEDRVVAKQETEQKAKDHARQEAEEFAMKQAAEHAKQHLLITKNLLKQSESLYQLLCLVVDRLLAIAALTAGNEHQVAGLRLILDAVKRDNFKAKLAEERELLDLMLEIAREEGLTD